MNKEELFALFKGTYKKTVEDNKEDFLKFCTMLSKLCAILQTKGILEKLDINVIFDINEEDLERGEE